MRTSLNYNLKLIILMFVLFLHSPSLAQENKKYCTTLPNNIGSPLSRSIQNITGLNFFATKAAEFIIAREVKKLLKIKKIDISIKSFGFGDLYAGKIKGFKVKAESDETENVYFSEFNAESLCEFTKFNYKNSSLKTPVLLKTNVAISKENIRSFLNSEKYKNIFKDINVKIDGQNIGKLTFSNIEPSIKNGKIYFVANLVYNQLFLTFEMPVNLEGEIKYIDQKLYLVNLKINSDSVGKDLKFLTESIKLDKIKIYDFKKLETSNLFIKVEKIEHVNDKIGLSGTILIEPVKFDH